MKRESKRRILLYPQYFLSNTPRRLGRRVSKECSVQNLTKEDLEMVLKELGLEYEVKDGVTYPRESNRPAFRIEVFTSERKQKLLKNIAMVIKKYKH
ncbi:MAG: signal recognition particle subunit SRP19/SEC65 family protein [Thermoproteota archaeon]